MAKPTKRKRSESEGAGERIVVSEVTLRSAARAYAAVATLGPSDPRWRRRWRALRLAAIGMVAEIREAAAPLEGHPPRVRHSLRSHSASLTVRSRPAPPYSARSEVARGPG